MLISITSASSRWLKLVMFATVFVLAAAGFGWTYRQQHTQKEDPVEECAHLKTCDFGLIVHRGEHSVLMFLRRVYVAMEVYRSETGAYPDSWSEISSETAYYFSRRDWPIGDVLDQMDSSKTRSSAWAHHKYVIKHATETDYLIHAIDAHDRVTWRVRPAVLDPEQLAPMYCPDENSDRDDPEKEAKHFLERARRTLLEHYYRHDALATKWSEIKMHYSLEDHFEQDERALPPAGTDARWKPPGARYTYVLENRNCIIRISTENELGLPNYFVEGVLEPPRRLNE